MDFKILRRQFTATGGSEDPLNDDPLTSKYMPSYKYVAIITKDNGTQFVRSFRTKREALELVKNITAKNKILK